jgi:hypothetical protein
MASQADVQSGSQMYSSCRPLTRGQEQHINKLAGWLPEALCDATCSFVIHAPEAVTPCCCWCTSCSMHVPQGARMGGHQLPSALARTKWTAWICCWALASCSLRWSIDWTRSRGCWQKIIRLRRLCQRLVVPRRGSTQAPWCPLLSRCSFPAFRALCGTPTLTNAPRCSSCQWLAAAAGM